jgi:hypothetical protein
MRYVGSMGDVPGVPGLSQLTAAQVASAQQQGAQLSDDQAAALALPVDASPFGSRQAITKYAIGGLAGLVIGVAVMKVWG